MRLADALAACPVVAILRGVLPEAAQVHAEALFEAGIRAVETPLNSPEPLASLSRIAAAFGERMAVGAGTVLSLDQVAAVAQAGGTFIVAPNANTAVIRRAVELGLDPVPGFATPSEAFVAYSAGARHLKLFPAATYGPTHLRHMMAVLPEDAVIWAVGGVGPDSLADWRAAGARAFGLGGELYRPGQAPAQTFDRAALAVAAARRLEQA